MSETKEPDYREMWHSKVREGTIKKVTKGELPSLPVKDENGIYISMHCGCQWKSVDGPYYNCKIKDKNPDGTYSVEYSDGDVDDSVNVERIKLEPWIGEFPHRDQEKRRTENKEIKEMHKIRNDIIQEELIRDETSNYLLLKEKIKTRIQEKMLEIRHKNNAVVYGFDNVEDYLTKLREIKEDPERWTASVYFHYGSEYPPVVVLSNDEKKTIHVHLLLKDYLGRVEKSRQGYTAFKGILLQEGINIDDICVNCDKVAEYGLVSDLKPKHCEEHKLEEEVERVNPLKTKIREAFASSGERKRGGSRRKRKVRKKGTKKKARRRKTRRKKRRRKRRTRKN